MYVCHFTLSLGQKQQTVYILILFIYVFKISKERLFACEETILHTLHITERAFIHANVIANVLNRFISLLVLPHYRLLSPTVVSPYTNFTFYVFQICYDTKLHCSILFPVSCYYCHMTSHSLHVLIIVVINFKK